MDWAGGAIMAAYLIAATLVGLMLGPGNERR